MRVKWKWLVADVVLTLLMPFWLIPVVFLLITTFLVGAFCATYLVPEEREDALEKD